MCVLLWKMRQDIDFQKARAELQALLAQKGASAEQINEVFKDLKSAFFPFDKNERQQSIQQMREAMSREMSRGKLALTPLVDMERKKIAPALVKGQKVMKERASMIQYGVSRPIDFDEEARKPRKR